VGAAARIGQVRLRDVGRRLLIALIALGAIGSCAGREARSLGAETRYDRPERMVRLPDGRRLNLRCSGRGSPTVILDAGFGSDASAWFKVQPQLARTTRVCAYDRAGYGFSDPGPLPRDGAAIARDLDAALSKAEINGPYVVVGHSAGALYGRLFAARRADEVVGLVLVDPTLERVAPPGSSDGLDGVRRRLRRCLAAASAESPPPPREPVWSSCPVNRKDAGAEALIRNPAAWENQLSELDNIFGRTSAQVPRIGGLLHEIPVHVLTASQTVEANPAIRLGQIDSPWLLGHRGLAAQSRYGSQRTVQSSHLIMIDRPDTVVDSVLEMVKAHREGRPPAPLGSAEEPFWKPEPEPEPVGSDVFDFF
jgi:pimeloyl-ACP methyl ester carboxylesterase